MSQKLFLIPSWLNDDTGIETIAPQVAVNILPLRIFLAEEPAAARKFIKKLCPDFPLQASEFIPYNEHTPREKVQEYLELIGKNDFGIISEAGCPCVADPGADIVLEAHRRGIEVMPLAGPSSILLALMASGLNGQNFAFNGYLPKERAERIKRIKELEARSRKEGQSQIFMETPYRNQHLFEDVLSTCQLETMLCVALDLSSPTQTIQTRAIQEWKKFKIDLGKRPAIFVISK